MSLSSIKSRYIAGALTKPEYIVEMHKIHTHLYEYSEFMRGTDISKIEILDGEVIMTARATGLRMCCEKSDYRIAPVETLNFGAYEENDSAMMRSLLSEGDTYFDVGANFGWYAISLAMSVRGLKVWAFEPVPKTYAYLQRNVALNDAANVVALNYGLSEAAGENVFYFYPEGSGNASLSNLTERTDVERVVCQLRRLDDVVAELGVRVDFIKCDVEGAELLVFKGGLETLRQHQPIVFSEMLRKWSARFNYHPNEIIALMRKLGYRCFTAVGSKLKEFALMDDATLETNFFFLHGTKHADKISHLVV